MRDVHWLMRGGEGRNAMGELIRAYPEGLAPGVSVDDALKLLSGEGPSPDRPGEPSNEP